MLYTCVQRFDVIGNLENLWELKHGLSFNVSLGCEIQ